MNTTSPAAAPSRLPHGAHILYVDDEAPIVGLGREYLERLGYRVTGRSDPEEAFRTFSQAPRDFDLLITDLCMPKMNGDILSREVHALRPDLPVILTTGFGRVTTAAAETGIRKVLRKPLLPRRLAAAVRAVLGR